METMYSAGFDDELIPGVSEWPWYRPEKPISIGDQLMNDVATELHLHACDGQDLGLMHNDFAVPQPTDPLPVTTIKLSDTTGSAFDPMGTLPPGLVAELNALKDGDPNTEITLTIYRGRCKIEVYL